MTRIAQIKVHPVSVPLKRALWTAHERIKTASLILVEVRTDDGLTGYGQIHGSPLKDICAWVERFGEVVKGMDALAHVAVWEKLFALTSPRPGGIGGRDGLPPPLPRASRPQITAAIGGIDIALWDVKGKAAGLPVYRLLGGENRPVLTYGTGGYYVEGEPLTACADELARFVANGYRAVKLKTGGESMSEEIERVRATRGAIGADILLMLDMNAAYGVHDCAGFARRVEPFAIHWLEEPLHWYLQPADYVRLAAATSIPLAHGERELHHYSVRDFLDCGAIRYVQFDSTRHGGFTESLRIAHLAAQRGVYVAPHHAPELHAHLVAAFPDVGFAVESHGDPQREPVSFGLYKERAEVRGSYVHLSDKPGFGIEIDWDFVAKHRA
ncbi:MAG: mandelate racemase/muconate lactonizing enzyme family protein [Betaproteobacteria bacterium]|nr:mandelate racemase/muconate lactonizing enzyme family protein [Betaproteobacteria bacterium]